MVLLFENFSERGTRKCLKDLKYIKKIGHLDAQTTNKNNKYKEVIWGRFLPPKICSSPKIEKHIIEVVDVDFSCN